MASQKDLIEQLISDIADMKDSLPNGNIVRIETAIKLMHQNQEDLKRDMKTIQKRLFNPDTGMVVQTNKNTDFRESNLRAMPKYNSIIDDFKNVLTWKKGVQRGLWVIYSTMIGIMIKLLFWS